MSCCGQSRYLSVGERPEFIVFDRRTGDIVSVGWRYRDVEFQDAAPESPDSDWIRQGVYHGDALDSLFGLDSRTGAGMLVLDGDGGFYLSGHPKGPDGGEVNAVSHFVMHDETSPVHWLREGDLVDQKTGQDPPLSNPLIGVSDGSIRAFSGEYSYVLNRESLEVEGDATDFDIAADVPRLIAQYAYRLSLFYADSNLEDAIAAYDTGVVEYYFVEGESGEIESQPHVSDLRGGGYDSNGDPFFGGAALGGSLHEAGVTWVGSSGATTEITETTGTDGIYSYYVKREFWIYQATAAGGAVTDYSRHVYRIEESDTSTSTTTIPGPQPGGSLSYPDGLIYARGAQVGPLGGWFYDASSEIRGFKPMGVTSSDHALIVGMVDNKFAIARITEEGVDWIADLGPIVKYVVDEFNPLTPPLYLDLMHGREYSDTVYLFVPSCVNEDDQLYGPSLVAIDSGDGSILSRTEFATSSLGDVSGESHFGDDYIYTPVAGPRGGLAFCRHVDFA